MTDDPSSPIVPQVSVPESKPAGRSKCRKLPCLIFLAFLIAAPIAGGYWLALKNMGVPMGGAGIGPMQQKVEKLQIKVQSLDTQLRDLTSRVDSIAALPGTTTSNAPATAPAETPAVKSISPAELAHVQNGLSDLAATVSGLENEVKQAGSSATAVLGETRMALAEAITYLRLRETATGFHAFAKELAALRATAKNDPALEDAFGKLTPLADKGAPTLPMLRESLEEQAMPAVTAIAKANALSWWEKILVELRGLVQVRPVHGGSTSDATLDAMETDLARDDLAGALDAMKNLAPEAQKALAGWQTDAEARLQINNALQSIGDRLVAGTDAVTPAPAPAAEPVPAPAPAPAPSPVHKKSAPAPEPAPVREEPEAPDTQETP